MFTTDQVLRELGLLSNDEIAELQQQMNVNLPEGDANEGYLDADEPSEIESTMREVSLEELQCQPC